MVGSNCKLQNFVPFQHYVNGTHVSRTVWFVFMKIGMQRKPVQVQGEHAPFAKKGFREPCDSNVEPSNHWITKCFLLWLILVKRELAFAPKGHVICFTQVVRIKIYLFTFTSWTFFHQLVLLQGFILSYLEFSKGLFFIFFIFIDFSGGKLYFFF